MEVYVTSYELKRRLVGGMLNLVLGALAAWLASYLTNRIVGEPPEAPQLAG